MEPNHEIKKLEFNIKGQLPSDVQRAISELVPALIESCFNQFSDSDKDILIDKIELNLGTIPSDNFVEELKIRLTYLLQTEFQKFFSQPNIYQELEEKALMSKADAFLLYLERGYSTLNQVDLSELFEHLLMHNIALLRELMAQMAESPQAMQRIFYQIPYHSLERYWVKVYPNTYKKIRWVVDVVLADTGYSLTKGQDKGGMVDFLKKMIFEYMNSPLNPDQPARGFVELLKINVDELKNHEHDLKTSAFQYLDYLAIRVTNLEDDTISQQYKKESAAEAFVSFLITGKKGKGFALGKRSEKDWEQIIEAFLEEPIWDQSSFQRLVSLLPQNQVEYLVNQISKKGNILQKERIRKIDYFRLLLKELFGEDIYTLSPQSLFTLITSDSSGKTDVKNQIQFYLELVSAKKQDTYGKLLERLKSRADKSIHNEAKALQNTLLQLQKELAQKSPPESKIPRDFMGAYMYFLKYGLWVLEGHSPQEVLLELLSKNKEHLIAELTRHLNIQVIWLRIIYQHTIADIKTVFQGVFEEAYFQLVKAKLKQYESEKLGVFHQRKLFEAFIHAIFLKQENEMLSFEEVYQGLLEDLNSDLPRLGSEESEVSVDQTQEFLTLLLKQEKSADKPNREQRARLVRDLVKNPHKIITVLYDQSIVPSDWAKFLGLFDKNDLFDLFRVMAGLRQRQISWMPSLLYFIEHYAIQPALTKALLLKLIPLLIIDTEANRQVVLLLLTEALKAKDRKLEEALSRSVPEVKAMETPVWTSLEGIEFAERVSAKNLEKYIEELEKLRIQLQQEGVVLTHSRFKQILLDILPFAENIQMLRSSFISKVKEAFPLWPEKINAIGGIEIEAVPYTSFAQIVAQSIAQGKVVYQVYFNTSLDFEHYLLQGYQYSEQIKAVLMHSNPRKVLVFINQLSTGTLQQFDQLIQNRFIPSEYIKIRQRIIDRIPTAEREIVQASIAYGVTNRAFSTFDFLRFINESLPETQAYSLTLLEDIGLSASELVPKMYVEAFIHYLKYDSYIYLYVEKDGPQEVINKVFSYYPDLFLQELSTEPNASQIAERLFQHIANEKQLKLFSGLIGLGEDYVTSVIAEVQASIKSHPSIILAHWLGSIISNTPIANRAELTQLLLSSLSNKKGKQAKRESTSWDFTADQGLPISILDTEYIAENEAPTAEQLLKEVTQSGQIPIWLKSVSQDNLSRLFQTIARQSPAKFGKLLGKYLKEVRQVQRLLQVVDRRNLETLLKISDPITLQEVLDSVKQLTLLHQSYGNKQALADYFFVRYLAFYYKYLAGDMSEQRVLESVIEAFIFDFGVNRADYRLMLEESKSPMAQEYIRVRGYSENNVSTELVDEAYQINLLFYIARENRLPWWVKEQEERNEPLDKRFSGLLTDLLERNPKQVMKELLRTPNREKVVQRIVPLLSSEQFFTILLILSPNFGGFIVSFTILIHRARLTTNQRFTYPFIINYLIDNLSFNPSEFVGRAISFTAAHSNKNPKKLIAQLQAVVSTAIKEGEMRFLPFVELLKENAESPQALDSPVSVEVKPFLSSSKRDEIELLIQLLLENKAPRWAEKYQDFSVRQIEQEIRVLSAQLIKQKPKEWIEAVISHPEKQKIIQRWNKRVDSTQINEAIIALSPSLGGFIISLAEVLRRSKLPIAQAEWQGFVFEFLTKKQNFDASDFVQNAISFLSRALNKNRMSVKEELQEAAQKASQKGEKRFAPVLDLLAGFSADTASSEEEIPEKGIEKEPFAYTFIDSVVYYLQTGAIPQNMYVPIGHYVEFIQAIERYIQLGNNELRLAIYKVLGQPKVQKRILREESEYFIQVILRVVFPKEADEVMAYKSQLLPHLQKKFETVSEQGLSELFYLHIFEQEMKTHTSSIHAPSFITSFVQFAAFKLNKVITFERAELEKWGIDKLLLELLLGKEQIPEQKPKPQKKPTQKREEPKPDALLVDHRVLIKNAGVVMVWPFLSRYFDILQMLEDGKFKSEEEAIRAVHLIQYIATGTTSAPEHALLLNKVLCGLAIATPVPLEVELSTKEIETTEMMLKGLLQNWERIKSSSIEALREGFLTRDGYMLEKEKIWELKVEKKTLDILMKDLPWAIGTIKLPWMEKRLVVEWL